MRKSPRSFVWEPHPEQREEARGKDEAPSSCWPPCHWLSPTSTGSPRCFLLAGTTASGPACLGPMRGSGKCTWASQAVTCGGVRALGLHKPEFQAQHCYWELRNNTATRARATIGWVRMMGACYVTKSCPTVTPWTVARQSPLFTEFSRQEYWSGLPCPPQGEGIEPVSPALQANSLLSEPPGK